VLDVRCDALLVDLRGEIERFPALVDRRSYAFCQQVGAYLHDQGQNGLLSRSARCDGTTAAILEAERLSRPRDKLFLTYRSNPVEDSCLVERESHKTWLRIRPSELE
jgi:hypothetical protein